MVIESEDGDILELEVKTTFVCLGRKVVSSLGNLLAHARLWVREQDSWS